MNPLNAVFLITRLVGCVIGTSCVMLVIFQLRHDRKSWLFALLTASVAVESFCGLAFHIVVAMNQSDAYELETTIFLVAAYFTTILEICVFLFCMEYLQAWTRLTRYWAVLVLTLPVPGLFLVPNGILPHSLVVNPNGTIDYVLSGWTYPEFGLGVITSFLIFHALYCELRNNEKHSAFRGSLITGVLLMVSGTYFPLIPPLKQYTVEHICYALGCVLLVRPVLQQSLFNPLAELNRLVERRAQMLAQVTQVNRRIAASLEYNALLSAAVGEICLTFSYARACLYLRDGEFFKLNACAGIQASEMQFANKRYKVGDGSAVGQAAATQTVITEPNMRYSGQLWAAIRSEANLPLIDQFETGGYVMGILALHSSKPDSFSADELDTLRLLTQQLVTAIHNARLFKEVETARETANEASEAKTQFLSMMSHELRSPLTVIGNLSRFMEYPDKYPGTSLSAEYREDVSKLSQTAQHMKQIVDGILDFAKIEAGEMDLRRRAIDPVPLLKEIHDQALKLANPGVRIVDSYAVPLPAVYADDVRLREILQNLVSNACNFCETGMITLNAQIEQDMLRFSVADTGPGIPPELQPNLFNRYKQAHRNTYKHGGTGLGLSISKHFVEMHGGRIWFESKLGAGMTFLFTIPLATDIEVKLPDEGAAPQLYDFGVPTAELPPLTVLVTPEHYSLPPLLRTLGCELIPVTAEHAVEVVALVEPRLTVVLSAERWPYVAPQLRNVLSSECPIIEIQSHEPLTALQEVLVKLSTRIEV